VKKMIKIIRKVDIEKRYELMLNLELDYELATLSDAMKANDEKTKLKCKKRLAEIQTELASLKAYS